MDVVMGTNLQLLGLQAAPRLAEKFDVQLEDFIGFDDLYGAKPKQFMQAYKQCGRILGHLFKEFNISWWDVYLSSDIGMERMGLAQDMGLGKDDVVLDVGCGRGYFTFAAARCSRVVLGLDGMDGMRRQGWWRSFQESVFELKLGRKIQGIKSDARLIPLKERSVQKAVAVHCIRNLQDRRVIQYALQEMNRVVTSKGETIIVENIPIVKNKAQEAHLAMFKCKCENTTGEAFYYTEEELLTMLEEADLREASVETVDYNLSATPPIFYLDVSRLTIKRRQKVEPKYITALDKVKKHGETSTPAIIIRISKHQ
ncbi:methyltransferase domain-containing protein [Candidatus Bathyarchaeota archaeon]|nr:methyltransferase domain-containing protein [Candidatus Bathyarchaeota archaeon]